jgi:Tol biopolymer transport system component
MMNSTRMTTVVCWAGALLLSAVLFSCESPTNSQPFQDSYLHARAKWSPDGKTIVFLASPNGATGIYAVDTSGSNLRLVYAGDTGGPTWSPDSKWLAFSQGLNLFKIKITGDSLAQLTSQAEDIRPSWSRDGNTIAFERSSGIWLLDLRTGVTRFLTAIGYYPSWLPNGTELAVQDPYTPPSYGFYAVKTDSGATRLLYSFTTQAYSTFPSVSANGREIVFSIVPGDTYAQIWKVDLQTSQVTQLTTDAGDYGAWSGDGSKIVYTHTLLGDGALWVMNSDGSNKHRLTSP